MKKYPREALLFLILLTAAAMVLLLLLLQRKQAVSIRVSTLLIWCVLSILSESFSIHNVKGNIYISPLEGIFYGAYLTCGPQAAAFLILLTYLGRFNIDKGKFRCVIHVPIRLNLFNVTHFWVILCITDFCFRRLQNLLGGDYLIPALAAAPLFFLLSCFLNAYFYKVEEGRSFFFYLNDILTPYMTDALAASFAAVLIGMIYPLYGNMAVLIFFSPLFVSLLSMERLGDDK